MIIYRNAYANNTNVRLAHVKINLNLKWYLNCICRTAKRISSLASSQSNKSNSNKATHSAFLLAKDSKAIHHRNFVHSHGSRTPKRHSDDNDCDGRPTIAYKQIPFFFFFLSIYPFIHSFSGDLVDLLHSKRISNNFWPNGHVTALISILFVLSERISGVSL